MKSPGTMPKDATIPNAEEPAKLVVDGVAFDPPSERRFYQVACHSEREAVFDQLAAQQGISSKTSAVLAELQRKPNQALQKNRYRQADRG